MRKEINPPCSPLQDSNIMQTAFSALGAEASAELGLICNEILLQIAEPRNVLRTVVRKVPRREGLVSNILTQTQHLPHSSPARSKPLKQPILWKSCCRSGRPR